MRCWVVALGVFLIGCTVSLAQPPRLTGRPNAPRVERDKPKTLDTLLPEVDWNAEQRGPLLAVVPKGTIQPRPSEPTFLGGDWGTTPLPLPEKGPRGYLLSSLSERFDYRAVSVGTVTVLAPARMTVLNTRLPRPNPYIQLSLPERLRYFQSTLTPQQWQRFASPEGIGPSDLNARQKEIFNALLPDPFRIIRSTRTEDANGNPDTEGIVLTPGQRAAIRLHMARKLDWYFRMGENGTYYAGLPPNNPHLPQVTYRVSTAGPGPSRTTLFGANVKEEVPARQKPGHLPFDWNGLDATVSLKNVGTVGELIQRVREATRLELYADRRYADCLVFFRGTSARSGDILRALALAVTGTYRKLGTAYILTDDLVGLGTRHAQIAVWQRAAVIEAGALREEMERVMKDVPLAEYIGWASDDPLGPNDALKARIEARRKELQETKVTLPFLTQFDKRNFMVSVSDMPPAVQGIIKEQVESYQKFGLIAARPGSTKPEIHPDKVAVNVEYSFRYLIPGLGVVEGFPGINRGGREFFRERETDNAAENSEQPPLFQLPLDRESRILTVGPGSVDEAVRLIGAAKRCGLTAVWVHADWEDTALIEAAVKAGKSIGIPVGAVVGILRTRTGTTLPTDINILGETSVAYAKRRLAEPPLYSGAQDSPDEDRNRRVEFQEMLRQGNWLRPDSPQVVGAILKNLKAIAGIPGLAALALSDLSAPGYRCEFDTLSNKDKEEGWQVGYSEEMRLAFLREKSVDPIDLSIFHNGRLPFYAFPRGSNGDLFLPLFPDYGPAGRYTNGSRSMNGVNTYDMGPKDAWEKWLEFRLEIKRQLVQTLVKQLKTVTPQLTLYGRIGDDDRFVDYSKGFALLTTPEQAADCLARRPPPNASFGMVSSIDTIKQTTKQALHLAGYNPKPDLDQKTDFARQARRLFHPETKAWDGFVLDLTTVSATDALALLEAFPTVEPGKP